MRKEDIYLDLSKLSKEERKEVINLLPEPKYSDDYDLYGSYKILHFAYIKHEVSHRWFVDYNISVDGNKTEITFTQFKELFQEEPQFKQGDKVLVRDDEDDEWLVRLYATEYNGNHYVEAKHSNELNRYMFIKPYEEQIKVGDWVKIMSNGLIFKSKENINKDDCWSDYKKITNPQLITLLENELSN